MSPPLDRVLAFAAVLLLGACQAGVVPIPIVIPLGTTTAPAGDATPPAADGTEGDF
jgi:hypothetical protein